MLTKKFPISTMTGKVETSGEVAYGMYAKNKSSAENREKITTSGESAHGMDLVEDTHWYQ